MADVRIGHGYDVHAFEPGDHVMLGGVAVPHDQAFKAHSDGDVLIHAICDAVLGALALGDIGRHFPDTDPRYAGADSRELLRRVVALMRDQKYFLGNLDATIIAQAPRLAPHVQAMREHLAADFSAELNQVNVKATTTERLGFAGRREGIASHAVVVLIKD